MSQTSIHSSSGTLSYLIPRIYLSLPDYLKFALQHCLTNIMCVPDFVAYKFADRNSTPSVKLCKKLWGAETVTWTLKTKEEYDTAVAEGWIPIFENFIP